MHRIILALLLTLPASAASVSLFLVGDRGERVVGVRPGASVGVNAWVFAPVDQIMGVDWKLDAASFTLAATSRSDWSPFADPLTNTPTLTSDLGAVVNSEAAGEGVWPLMRLTLTAPSVPGIYNVMPTSEPGTGWVDSGFGDNEFTSFGGMTVVVSAGAAPAAIVPEPATLAAMLFIGAALLRRRR